MAEGKTDDKAETSMLTDPVSLLPDVDSLKEKHYVVRRARINDFAAELQRLGAIKEWKELTIYADEIIFDINIGEDIFGFDLTGRSRFTLLTRKLTIKGTGRLVILSTTPGASTVVELAVQEFVGPPIEFIVAKRNGNVVVPDDTAPPEHPRRIEKRVALKTAVVGEQLDRKRLGWQTGSEFYWSLVSTFQHGFARIDTDRDEACRTFLWVYENTRDLSWWAPPNAEMASMAAQSFAMFSRLARTPPPWHIPIRDHRALRTAIETRIKAAQALEQSYETFVNRQLDARTRAIAVRDAIAESRAQEEEAARVLAAAKEELAKVQKAYRADVERVSDQNKKLQDLALAFEKGVKDYQFAQIVKAATSLGTSLAALAGGAPPTGVVSAVAGAANVVDKIDKIAELINAIKKVAEPLQKLAKIGAVLKDSYKVATTIAGATESARKLETFKDDDAAIKLTDTDWKVLRERFQGALGGSLSGDDKISGAAEYLEGGRILAIYGEAMYATHLNVMRLMEHIINLTMRKKMYEAQLDRLASLETRETQTDEAFAEAQLLLRQRYLDVKRGLMFELEDFGDAYRYWALREPSRSKLRMMPQVAQMSELRVGLQAMIEEGLDGLFPVAQQPVICHVVYKLWPFERDMLARGEPVIVNVPRIPGWSRVRVNNLQGVTFDNLTDMAENRGKNLRCHVRSSGTFTDSWNGKTFEFTAPLSQEFSRSFIVGAGAGAPAHAQNVILSADSGQSGGDLGQYTNMPYYLPGLYTHWSVRLPRGLGDNNSIDVSGVAVIRLAFSGWAMGVNAGEDADNA